MFLLILESKVQRVIAKHVDYVNLVMDLALPSGRMKVA
jgi:hypothetical protein